MMHYLNTLFVTTQGAYLAKEMGRTSNPLVHLAHLIQGCPLSN